MINISYKISKLKLCFEKVKILHMQYNTKQEHVFAIKKLQFIKNKIIYYKHNKYFN